MTSLDSNIFDELVASDLDSFLSHRLLGTIPTIFEENRVSYMDWKQDLSRLLDVDSYSILFVGSAALGFSLNPHKAFKPFGHDSDVDIAVISARYFDAAWHFFRTLGSTRFRLPSYIQSSIKENLPRDVYWGMIATDRLLPYLPFGPAWVRALESMSRIDPTADRRLNLRLYRDIESLRSYQLRSLKIARDRLLAPTI